MHVTDTCLAVMSSGKTFRATQAHVHALTEAVDKAEAAFGGLL